LSCATCLTTQVSDPTDSIYVITITDIYGCVDTAQVRLDRTERPEIFIPNVFNPNSNSGNSKFIIYGNTEVDRILNLKVFDRWGNMVYISQTMELNNSSSGWDGTYNGQDVEQGVYVYLIEVLLGDGSVKVYHGDLTVVR
jgi:gliding motility-associated-like protein